ncbi:hypothetical protein [Streptomyces sp. NPDC013187]|uniref:hypothetical protein n=1 Tax=Streptomyces sp. NPDC013187 TaxID=3364865 RepID=UPI00367491A2
MSGGARDHYVPSFEEIVKDTGSGKVGVYRGTWAGSAWLRPVGGGREWEVEATNIRQATQEERMKAQLDARNHVIGGRP